MKDIATVLVMGIVLSVPVPAAEGALGRSLPGVWVMPQAGVVGPGPGFSFSTMPIGYMGSISGNIQIPIAGSPAVSIQFRWVPEFAVTNLIKGNTLLLGLTLKLD